MFDQYTLIETLQKFGVGRRSLSDEVFGADETPARLGIYDEDQEDLYEQVVRSWSCTIPGCVFTATSLLELENHYNVVHRYSCGECRRTLPSPHLLDLHVQETHDSFFAVMASRKPSYCCYIQECPKKFMDVEERSVHCVKVHRLPKDFRFEIKSKNNKSQNTPSMDVDATVAAASRPTPEFAFHNSKQKGLIKYSGRKFTSNNRSLPSSTTSIDEIMLDIKENLPK